MEFFRKLGLNEPGGGSTHNVDDNSTEYSCCNTLPVLWVVDRAYQRFVSVRFSQYGSLLCCLLRGGSPGFEEHSEGAEDDDCEYGEHDAGEYG